MTRSGWTVDVIELPPPVQGERRSKRQTHRVVAIDKARRRVIRLMMTADEAAAFDPDMHWRGMMSKRRAG